MHKQYPMGHIEDYEPGVRNSIFEREKQLVRNKTQNKLGYFGN